MLMHIKVIVEEDAICIAMELLIPVIVTIIFIKGEFLLFYIYIYISSKKINKFKMPIKSRVTNLKNSAKINYH